MDVNSTQPFKFTPFTNAQSLVESTTVHSHFPRHFSHFPLQLWPSRCHGLVLTGLGQFFCAPHDVKVSNNDLGYLYENYKDSLMVQWAREMDGWSALLRLMRPRFVPTECLMLYKAPTFLTCTVHVRTHIVLTSRKPKQKQSLKGSCPLRTVLGIQDNT